jgi:hypothetical protein
MVDRSGRGPQFGVHDALPFVRVPEGESPVVLEGLDVAVVVSGMFAETTQTLTFRNPNGRPLEGALEFPLPEGAVVCGYAIDLEGELVDGVIVPKKEARRILEAEIRKGVDPGLVEQVQGNVYRTRIYPLPPGGTRTVRLTYVADLACDGQSAAYHLPLAHAKDLPRASLRVEIKKGDAVPAISGGLGNMTLASLGDAYVAQAVLPRGTACDDLLVRLPDLPRHLRAVERTGDETFFAVSTAIPGTAAAWTPRRVALLWDASGSRHDVERDLELVSALLDAWPRLAIDVRVLRDVVAGETRAFAGRADRDRLLGFLRDVPRDGGTNLAAIDLRALPDPADEAWLVFSDGLNTIGRGVPATGAVPVIAISSSARSDAAYLRHIASQSGVYIDLLQTTPESALQLVTGAREALRVVGAEGCADVHVRRAAGRLSIVGRLTAELGQVRLAGSGAPDDHISIPRAMAVEGHLVARAWAGQHTRALAVVDPDQPRILELARRHGVVTASASLLVLETLEQHLEYGIEPAASRRALRARYLDERERVQGAKRATAATHLERVVALWQERVRWWQTEHRPRPKAAAADSVRSMPAASRMRGAPPALGAPTMLAGFMADHDAEGAPRQEVDLADGVAGSESMQAEEILMELSRSTLRAAPMLAGPPSGGAPAPRPAPAVGGPQGARIQIQPWSADAPYLRELERSEQPYADYLRQRADYGASPAFFLDCGDLFLRRNDRATGLRVLSNLLEPGLDHPPLMRMYAWRLQQVGELDAAIDVFERVRRMRDDEPQSHRDLALALAERWEQTGAEVDVTRAMDLLCDVIEKAWDRFPEIELIVLMELNRLIARARERGIATPARIDPRLVRLLDLDLRISMSWDLDLTDVDLHVFEPNGEHAYYSHNWTSGGGLVSRDFRQGYGPEEYVRRTAEPGAYTIKAHYYGSHQQDVAGACTVIVHVMLNFGRANEERQVMTLRLDRPSNQVTVGDVTFAGRAIAPVDDWRPRFKKLRRGMAIDEIVTVVGQPTRIEGAEPTVMVYELDGGDVVHVLVGPRLTAVHQVIEGAVIDLV